MTSSKNFASFCLLLTAMCQFCFLRTIFCQNVEMQQIQKREQSDGPANVMEYPTDFQNDLRNFFDEIKIQNSELLIGLKSLQAQLHEHKTQTSEQIADIQTVLKKNFQSQWNKISEIQSELNEFKTESEQMTREVETRLGLQINASLIKNAEKFDQVYSEIQNSTNTVENKFHQICSRDEEKISDALSMSITDLSPNDRPKSCEDIQENIGSTVMNGVYQIYPYPLDNIGVEVFCDMTTDGGGWTVIQRRLDETNFNRTWDMYAEGFGNVSGSFWLGLTTMHQLTKNEVVQLRVEVDDWEGNSRFAVYKKFRVGGQEDKFRLHIGNYSGDAGDSLDWHNGQMFTTFNQDNDNYSGNCAVYLRSGGWWYSDCGYSGLNGIYFTGTNGKLSGNQYRRGVFWHHRKGDLYSYKRAEMKIRSASYVKAA